MATCTPGERVCPPQRAALVRDVIDLDGCELHQQLDAEMADAALPERRDGDGAGLGPRDFEAPPCFAEEGFATMIMGGPRSG
jgi:hypothetical protein